MACASIFAAFLNFVLNFIFIPIFGYKAAAYTTYIGYFVLLIAHMFLVWKIGKADVYNNKVIFLIATLSSILIFSTNLVLDRYKLRYLILIFYLIFIFVVLLKNKAKIRKIFAEA